MERRLILLHQYVSGSRQLPEKIILKKIDTTQLTCPRLGLDYDLILTSTYLTTVESSSLNTARTLWNALPREVKTISQSILFNHAVTSRKRYLELESQSVWGIGP
uniref:Uncharacterized protein n=1 Tax=Acrobeloides nanus TaxID=290746 RepID=A0A914DSC2_9BILA